MLPTIYTVSNIGHGTLSVMAKPISNEWIEEEFNGLKQLGIDKIVSLLEKFEQCEFGLAQEESLCIKNNMEYASFPIADRGLPNTQRAQAIIKQLFTEISEGKHIVVHCRAGIGRTGMIAAGILVNAGKTHQQALELVSSARGVQAPDTEEQAQWLRSNV